MTEAIFLNLANRHLSADTWELLSGRRLEAIGLAGCAARTMAVLSVPSDAKAEGPDVPEDLRIVTAYARTRDCQVIALEDRGREVLGLPLYLGNGVLRPAIEQESLMPWSEALTKAIAMARQENAAYLPGETRDRRSWLLDNLERWYEARESDIVARCGLVMPPPAYDPLRYFLEAEEKDEGLRHRGQQFRTLLSLASRASDAAENPQHRHDLLQPVLQAGELWRRYGGELPGDLLASEATG